VERSRGCKRPTSFRLVNVQPAYLEGRRGIELTYRAADGHAVTYIVLPAGPLALPERGRVQIERWRSSDPFDGLSVVVWPF
jgi:hypothetical protein